MPLPSSAVKRNPMAHPVMKTGHGTGTACKAWKKSAIKKLKQCTVADERSRQGAVTSRPRAHVQMRTAGKPKTQLALAEARMSRTKLKRSQLSSAQLGKGRPWQRQRQRQSRWQKERRRTSPVARARGKKPVGKRVAGNAVEPWLYHRLLSKSTWVALHVMPSSANLMLRHSMILSAKFL